MSDHKPKIEIDPSLLDEAVEAVNHPDSHSASEESSNESYKPQTPSAEDFKDRWIRTSADFDNFRKRSQKEKADLMKYGNESLLKDLLPVMDNFERALATTGSKSTTESVIQGVQMIYSQLKSILERYGVTADTALGKPFDPNLHEAMSHKEAPAVAPHTVVEEHQKMYFFNKKLIRPALVTVSKESNKLEEGSREAETVEYTPDT